MRLEGLGLCVPLFFESFQRHNLAVDGVQLARAYGSDLLLQSCDALQEHIALAGQRGFLLRHLPLQLMRTLIQFLLLRQLLGNHRLMRPRELQFLITGFDRFRLR